MRKLPILLILLLVAWFSCALADGLTIEPYAGGFRYSFQAEDEFLVLRWKTDTESARVTVYAENGEFSGDVTLPHTFAPSPLKVTVETLQEREILSAKAETVAVEPTCSRTEPAGGSQEPETFGYRNYAAG